YEKYGGFQELLNGVWEVLPEGTPLIGGTVAGFMNNYGCFARGVTGLAVYYPRMDVAVGVGHNTKRSPKKAGKRAAEMIRSRIKDGKFENKFLFVVISGPTLPQSEGFGTLKIITDKRLSKLLSKLTNISTRINQIGLGRESEVLEGLCEGMMEYSLIGISSNDDNRYMNHFQFYKDNVYKNSVVTLGINTDLSIYIKTSYGLIPTGKKAKVTGTENWNYIIKSLDNKPAVDVFFEKTGIMREIITDENIHRITPFLPIGCYHKDGTLHPYPVASFLGEYLLVGHNIVNDEIEFFLATGESLLKAVDESLKHLPNTPKFMIISSCAGRLETLGKMIYAVRDKIMERVDCPFLTLYGLGEERKDPFKPPHLLQESFNVAAFI
ncbi:MAG: hypothetical protein DRN25_04690, partial [Thermoplasmata archaeon]